MSDTISAIGHAIKGLADSSRRIEKSAENIASFGTQTPQTQPQDEVNLSEEAVNLSLAETSYKANLAVIQTVNELTDELLDSFDKKV